MNAIAGRNGWIVMKPEDYLLQIIRRLHSGKELCHPIVKINQNQVNLLQTHSFEDDTQDSVEYESEMVISTSLSNLNI
jgi:hypothetical protein